ncbi:hypothetical protein GS575_05255 [Rhodococcus hoagii]|nr:hypothetical protein [Prescottella equi]
MGLSAQVTPSTALGSVQFRVNGSPAGAAVPVSGGEAVLPYTFDAAGFVRGDCGVSRVLPGSRTRVRRRRTWWSAIRTCPRRCRSLLPSRRRRVARWICRRR